jgi:hypothetical protein
MIYLRLILVQNWREEYFHWVIILLRVIIKLRLIQLKMALVPFATMIQIALMDNPFSSKLHMYKYLNSLVLLLLVSRTCFNIFYALVETVFTQFCCMQL